MLGRREFSTAEVERARTMIDQHLAAHRRLASSLADPGAPDEARAALSEVSEQVFNHLALALDRCFVHRLRVVAGKDGNPLNELDLISESLMTNDGVFQVTTGVRYTPDRAVVGLRPGDPVLLTADQFDQLSTAFLAEIERRYAPASAAT